MNLSLVIYEAIKWLTPFLPIIIPLVAIALLFLSPRSLLFAFLCLLGFQAIFIDLGLMVTVPRVLLVFIIVSLIVHLPKKLNYAISAYPAKEILIVLLLFFVFSTLFNLPFFPQKTMATAYGTVGDSLFRDRASRELSQIIMFLLRVSVPVAIIALGTKTATVAKMVKALFLGTTALCAYGIYQLAAYFYKLPALYIFRGAFGPAGDLGIINTPWGNLLRISSLTGEPKDFAAILLPVLILLGALLWYLPKEAKGYSSKKITLGLLFVLHFVLFVLTFSTAAWLAGLLILFLAIILIVKKVPSAGVLAVVTAFLLSSIGAYYFIPSVNTVVKSRLLNRVSASFLENSDYGAPQLLHMYKTHPHTIFIGASLGGAVFYEQYNEQPESPIYYLFDYGIVGLVILIIFFRQIGLKYYRDGNGANLPGDYLRKSLLLAMIASMISTLIFPKIDSTMILWTVIGLCGAAVLSVNEAESGKVIREGAIMPKNGNKQ